MKRAISPWSEPTGPGKQLLRHDNLRAGVGDFSPNWAFGPSRTAGLLAHSVKPTQRGWLTDFPHLPGVWGTSEKADDS